MPQPTIHYVPTREHADESNRMMAECVLASSTSLTTLMNPRVVE